MGGQGHEYPVVADIQVRVVTFKFSQLRYPLNERDRLEERCERKLSPELSIRERPARGQLGVERVGFLGRKRRCPARARDAVSGREVVCHTVTLPHTRLAAFRIVRILLKLGPLAIAKVSLSTFVASFEPVSKGAELPNHLPQPVVECQVLEFAPALNHALDIERAVLALISLDVVDHGF